MALQQTIPSSRVQAEVGMYPVQRRLPALRVPLITAV